MSENNSESHKENQPSAESAKNSLNRKPTRKNRKKKTRSRNDNAPRKAREKPSSRPSSAERSPPAGKNRPKRVSGKSSLAREPKPLPESPEYYQENAFAELGVCPEAIQALEDLGFVQPTPIQEKGIPAVLKGSDIIGAAHTGTGKTAAFCLPIITRLSTHNDKTRCLIIEPTRELAQQVYDALETFLPYFDLRTALIYGGVKYARQEAQLNADPDIVIATPGRLLDHLGKGNLRLDSLEVLVLDEADRMLDMGFLPDIRKIVNKIRGGSQNLLFSATCPPEIDSVAKWLLRDPVRIDVSGGVKPATTINHVIYPVDDRQKFDLLTALLASMDYHSVLVFCRTKNGADMIARWLINAGHDKVTVLHSDRSQSERTRALKGFKEGQFEVFVATDIVARGIDISDVSHVINYDIPENPEDYVHRIGRTGRMHRQGDAMTLYTAMDQSFLKAIERLIQQPIPRNKLEGFDYNWTPHLHEKKPAKKRRNRGYSPASQVWNRKIR